MSPSFDLTCVVPRSGRTLRNFLHRLVGLGANAEEIAQIVRIMDVSKGSSNPDLPTVLETFRNITRKAPPCFSVFVDRKRAHRPYRIGFLGYEWQVGKHRLRVEGEEPHNGLSLIKLDEVDFAVVGLDELLSMTQYYLRNPTLVTKWGMYNYHLEKPTGIRIAGSAMLTSHNAQLDEQIQDMVGFFLISKPGSRSRSPVDLETLSKYGRRVYVKGRYTGIVYAAYPGLHIVSVEDVEEAVTSGERGSVGIEIVQSGNTLKRKGLVLHGSPLFLSESLLVVDYDRYVQNTALRNLIESLKPIGYFEAERIRQFAKWFYALEQNLGESWIEQPAVESLFCVPEDVPEGLRPYRLQTRKWKPDDRYKRGEAEALVERSRQQLRECYETLKLRNSPN